ncbi:MAG: hypothetical protein AAF624_07505 [Bacteroidota bacterium]
MHRSLCFAFALLLSLSGCVTTSESSSGGTWSGPRPDAPAEPTPPRPSPFVDGNNVTGSWRAVEAIADPERNRDLREGVLTMELTIRRDGTATLRGEDRRLGSGPVRFDGTLAGERLAFDGMDGSAAVSMRSGRLLVFDPRGRRTVYARES